MNVEEGIKTLNELSQMGTVAILLLIVGALGYYIWTKEKSANKTDNILDKLSESNDRIATAFEHQNKTLDWLKNEVEHHRNANDKLKDSIHGKLLEVDVNVRDIKMAVLSGRSSI